MAELDFKAVILNQQSSLSSHRVNKN